MGMGNYPSYADVVGESFVEEQCPELLFDLKKLMKEADIDFDNLCMALDETYGIDSEIEEDTLQKITETYKKLQKHFKQMTDLDLYAIYTVDKEDADRGCDITGGCWSVGNVYVLTEAGKKYESKIERVGWTVYG